MQETAGGAAPAQGHRRPALSRDTVVVTGAMMLLSVVAWVYLVWMPVDGMARGILAHRAMDSMDMGSMDMGSMDMDSSMPMPATLMDVSGWAASLPLFLAMWVVMMVAMMFPAVSPVVLLFERWRSSRQRSVATTIAFVAGYLIILSVAGVFAFAAIVALDLDRKSTRLNSSHVEISYAVFCL